MPDQIDHNKVVVLTGAGISAESGLQTFRDMNGLWNAYSIDKVATPDAWERNPRLVLEFYNERRKKAVAALPNDAHKAIAALEEKYEVRVITQNVDDLHERAGSTKVIHVHGELVKARSTADPSLVYEIGGKEINLGDVCDKGSQLRPHIVWFGEEIHNHELSIDHIRTAGKVLVVGTSLTVYPAAGMVTEAHQQAEKILLSLDIEQRPYGFHCMQGKAVDLVPTIVRRWMEAGAAT
ncbi:MAG: Sir2 family NAD-dependent protein deacetylase [Candidatus Thiodiazotropha sp.]